MAKCIHRIPNDARIVVEARGVSLYQTRLVTRIIINRYDDFNDDFGENEIAVLQLSHALDFSNSVQPIMNTHTNRANTPEGALVYFHGLENSSGNIWSALTVRAYIQF